MQDRFETEPAPDEPTDLPSDYADAAKVASLAEAGYLVSVLQAEGLDAVVRHTKSFSAINGAWLTDYVVQAPKEQLAQVAAVLRVEASQMNEETDFTDEAQDKEGFRQVVWRPVALMAVAGVISFVAGQHLAVPAPRSVPRDLANAVERLDQPFFTTPDATGAQRRLFYDRRTSEWLLDTDLDGDGRYDKRARFSGSSEADLPAAR